MVHPDDVPRARETLARVIGRPGTAETIEVRIKHRDGSVRIVDVVGKCIDDASRRVIITSRDITERRKLEEHLQRAHKLESLGVFAGGLALRRLAETVRRVVSGAAGAGCAQA